jgi:multimeric flavodoxin WrbA
MKIVCVLGSPREDGNSATIARRFCQTAERQGAIVKTYLLNKMTFLGCQGCFLCKTKLDRCALKDDLTEVLDAIRETDVLVLASPVYYWDVTSQTKAFLDRTFSYLVPDFLTNAKPSRLQSGKKFVFILTQGNPDESKFTDIIPKFNYFFERYGFEDRYFIRACGVREPGEVESHEDVLMLAERTARNMCAS